MEDSFDKIRLKKSIKDYAFNNCNGILKKVIKMDQKQEMIELVNKLNKAARAYYATDEEIMTNLEYDALYEKLEKLEQETGMILSNSPTQRVGYEILSELPKVAHATPMLSLDKTKDPNTLRDWLNFHQGVMSWKLDGLTIVLTYNNGELIQAVTRGNGEEGEVITNNARVFENIPLKIAYQDELVVRGEAIITYDDFEKINAAIEIESEKYKNPRNLCSGSVRQLNNKITKERHVRFVAFNLVGANIDDQNSRMTQFSWLSSLGFEVVEHYLVDEGNILDTIRNFEQKIQENPYPSDGLVLTYEDIAYGQSLGRTSKFPRHSIAFKWQDEQKETRIKEIEWSASRTGLINPVAIFEPVELEGTTVSRASLHNVSILENLEIGIGDRVLVYKANMIIPQIAENLDRSRQLTIPDVCPVCQGKTIIKDDDGIRTLYCTNPDCQAKHLKSFVHFVSRDAMNIEGLSEMTLEKFIALGYIKEFADLFKLDQYRLRIENMEGFGKKSYANLTKSLIKAKQTTAVRFLYGLGIPNIGLANAKLIVAHFKGNIETIRTANLESLIEIDGIGEVMAKAFVSYMSDEKKQKVMDDLLEVVEIEPYQASDEPAIFLGLTFCVTGTVMQFKNRNELKAVIEQRGGKVTGSVTSKTNYLINNDITSSSGKNKKAKELNVPIIEEATLVKWIESGEIVQ